jgi:Tol biopolymer transport system component
MKRFDRRVILFLVILLELILLLVLQGDQVGVRADLLTPAEGEDVGIYGPLRLQFSQPMDQASVESHFSLNPAVPGRFEWEAETLRFFPETALNPERTYTLTLSEGAQSASGRELIQSLNWTITVRSPDVLYLSLAEGGGDLWRWDAAEEATKQLTETDGAVIDFDPSRTGEEIVFAALNKDGGSDLWIVDRDGESETLLLSCGPDYCSQPTWSPDGVWVAYARQAYDDASGSRQAPRIWTLNVATQDTNPLYQSDDAYGHSPSFSPDGGRLASYDLTQNGIRILNLETSQEAIIPTSLQDLGDWSADGKRYLFTNLIPSVLESESTLYIADLETGSIQQALGGDVEGTTFSRPRWSPDGEWSAVALRPTNSAANRALWILKIDGSEAIAVANDGTADFSSYRWNPWGTRLVYQTYRSGDPTSPSAVWLWDWESREPVLLAEGAARPVWLP